MPSHQGHIRGGLNFWSARSSLALSDTAPMQGALAPVAASVVLFGSYLLIKALPQLTLQRIFNAYFFCLGTFAVSGGVRAPVKSLVGPSVHAAGHGVVLPAHGARLRQTGGT